MKTQKQFIIFFKYYVRKVRWDYFHKEIFNCIFAYHSFFIHLTFHLTFIHLDPALYDHQASYAIMFLWLALYVEGYKIYLNIFPFFKWMISLYFNLLKCTWVSWHRNDIWPRFIVLPHANFLNIQCSCCQIAIIYLKL